jgi:dTDP-4-dehydrorhamnose reductase
MSSGSGEARYKTVIITGARGQLARALIAAAPAGTQCIGLDRRQLDITSEDAVAQAIEEMAPDLVINGAAYNLVDRAEAEGMAEALTINALGVGRLARGCREAGIPLVHFSTDFVFDGAKRTPYTEEDATCPLGVYAASKLAGENIALAASPRNFAIRVCRLFGPVEAEPTDGGTSQRKPAGNFPLLMLRLGRERESVRVVSDQIGSPSYTPDLAVGTWQLLQHSDGGLYHLSNAGEVAFDEYTRTIFQLAGLECRVESVTSAEYGAPARRPLYSTLSNEKAHAAGVTPLRHWREALAEFIAAELKKAEPEGPRGDRGVLSVSEGA